MPRPFFEGAKRGQFRFGTLSEYRSWGDKTQHRLSDTTDGTWAVGADASAQNFTGQIAGGTDQLVHSTIPGRVQTIYEYDALVFCGSEGRYRRDVLERIRSKDDASSLDRYVVLDTLKFMKAIAALFQLASPGTKVGYGMIDYVQAKETLVAEEQMLIPVGAPAAPLPEPDVKAMVFKKPTTFAHEEEFRVVGFRDDQHAAFVPILSSNFSEARVALAASIVDAGEF